MKRPLLLSIVLFINLFSFAQPQIEWQKSFGGSGGDYAYSIIQTSDGGYAIAGATYSSDGDISGYNGNGDFWIVKIDAQGNVQWQKALGGSDWDEAYSIRQTDDGGFVIAGYSKSNDGDVSGNHGAGDYWIVKLDSYGNIQWQKSLGGSDEDWPNSIIQTSDGGYIVVGWTYSNDGDVSGNHSYYKDYWIVKLDANGNIQWQKCLGGSENDEAFSIIQTSDGGYLVAGYSESNDGDVSGNHGNNDFWIVKLDSYGNIQWQKCFGGSSGETAYSIVQTSDGGYLVAGSSGSNDGDVSGNHGDSDYWIIKLDSYGNIQWQKCFGGSYSDKATSVSLTSDGEYIIAGYSWSDDGDVAEHYGSPGTLSGYPDYWVIKLDETGNIQWQKTLGGYKWDEAHSVILSKDGSYVVAGFSTSNDGDVSENYGGEDYWIVKLTENNNTVSAISYLQNQIDVYPNPTVGKFTVDKAKGYSLDITDISGKVIKHISDVQSDNLEIDLSSYSKGIYILKLYNGTDVKIAKIVVQ